MSSFILAFFLIPAVSIRLKSNPNLLYLESILSLVVPEIFVTMFRSFPIIALINDDFPAFGLPTTAKLGSSSSIFFLARHIAY